MVSRGLFSRIQKRVEVVPAIDAMQVWCRRGKWQRVEQGLVGFKIPMQYSGIFVIIDSKLR